jgi:hypothetical protein
VRISVRLINTQSGEHIWADRFDRPFVELFEILDEPVSHIVGTIVGRVETADMAETRRKRPEDMTAYDYLLRGLEYHRLAGVTLDNEREALKWFERAISADPNYGLAYAWRVCASSWLPDPDNFGYKHTISFFRGELAWQSILTNNRQYPPFFLITLLRNSAVPKTLALRDTQPPCTKIPCPRPAGFHRNNRVRPR